jgi:hypothetical protein
MRVPAVSAVVTVQAVGRGLRRTAGASGIDQRQPVRGTDSSSERVQGVTACITLLDGSRSGHRIFETRNGCADPTNPGQCT